VWRKNIEKNEKGEDEKLWRRVWEKYVPTHLK